MSLEVGFFPITGDPIHYGHLRAALQVRRRFQLDRVDIQVCGDLLFHKPNKVSAAHRRAMAEIAVREFDQELAYSAIGIDTDVVGEEAFVQFMNDARQKEVRKYYYVAGSENAEIVRSRFVTMGDKLTKAYELVFISRLGTSSMGDERVLVSDVSASSSRIRSHLDIEHVPEAVLRYCRDWDLYGFAHGQP